jgi:hypothetical protein
MIKMLLILFLAAQEAEQCGISKRNNVATDTHNLTI